MKKMIISALLFFCTSPCYALLSPLNQSVEEMLLILQSHELQKKIPQSQALTSIQQFDDGYVVTTDQLEMEVEIHYIPSTGPGKQQFNLFFHDPQPIVEEDA